MQWNLGSTQPAACQEEDPGLPREEVQGGGVWMGAGRGQKRLPLLCC